MVRIHGSHPCDPGSSPGSGIIHGGRSSSPTPPAAHPPGHASSRFNFLIVRIPCDERAKAMPANQACAGRPKKQRLTLVSSFDEFAPVLGLLGPSRTPREIRFASLVCERCQKQLAEHGKKKPSATLGGANWSTREPHGATQNKKDANNSSISRK